MSTTPGVGDTVVYYNDHGFPRAALVTGTKDSLVGEKHVKLIEGEAHLHLHVFSPLPRHYPVLNVPKYDPAFHGDKKYNTWEPR